LQENALSMKREFHLRTIHFLRTWKETKCCECYLAAHNFLHGCWMQTSERFVGIC